jgi:hypothetical protein
MRRAAWAMAFLGLCLTAWLWGQTSEEVIHAPPEPPARAPPTPPVPTALLPPVSPADASAPKAAPAWPRHLEAPLSAVAPHIEQCVADVRHRAGRTQVRVTFTPRPDGGFAPGTRVTLATADPLLLACIEDVFEEVGFAPLGPEREEPATYDFDF